MKPNNPKRLLMLNNIKRALKIKREKPFPEIMDLVWQPQFDEDPVVEFAKQFMCNGGSFHYAESSKAFFDEVVDLSRERDWKYVYCWDKELYDYWLNEGFTTIKTGKKPYNISAAVVRCEGVIAQNGIVLLSNRQEGATFFAQNSPVLIIMVNITQVFATRVDAFAHIRESKTIEPLKQLIELSGNQYQHPFFEVENTTFGASEIIVYLVDEVFDLI